MTICRYYLQGNCRFGDRCRFEHTDPYYDENENSRRGYSSHDSSYQNRYGSYQASPNYNYDRNYQQNRNFSGDSYGYSNSNYRSDTYNQNRNYSPEPQSRHEYGGFHRSASSYDRYSSNQPPQTYYDNNYGKNKHEWVSEDYKKKLQQKSQRGFNDTHLSTSTPVSFSFKDPDVQPTRKPDDLYMNEKNMLIAELIKEDATVWDLGNIWLFTCYAPIHDKPAFPGFVDLSAEEMRYEAYKAKENNTYISYIESVAKTSLDIKRKREQLREPSIELMSTIERIRSAKDMHTGIDCIDEGTLLSTQSEYSLVEEMVADESSIANSASSFSFKMPSEADVKTAASAFSFKTSSDTSTKILSTGILTTGTSTGILSTGTISEIYTPLERLSDQDKEQFLASTFTLGKIPTLPPPREFCT